MESYAITFILALGIVTFGMYNLVRSWKLTRATGSAWYAVGRQHMATSARNVGLQAALLFIAGGALLVWMLFNPPTRPEDEPSEVSPIPTMILPTVATVVTETLTVSPATLTPGASLSISPEITSGQPLVAIPMPDLNIQAVITRTGGGGLWLRDAPFGNGLVLLPEESIVFVRGGLMEVDGLLWQNVADSEGREGWVAADFLIYR